MILLVALHALQELGLYFGAPGFVAGVLGWILLGGQILPGGKNVLGGEPWEPSMAVLIPGLLAGLLLGGGLTALNAG